MPKEIIISFAQSRKVKVEQKKGNIETQDFLKMDEEAQCYYISRLSGDYERGIAGKEEEVRNFINQITVSNVSSEKVKTKLIILSAQVDSNNNMEEVVRILEKNLHQLSDSSKVDILQLILRLCIKNGNEDQFRKYLNLLIQLAPEHPRIRRLQYQLRLPDDKYNFTNFKDYEPLCLAGDKKKRDEDYDEAASIYCRAISLNPYNVDAWNCLRGISGKIKSHDLIAKKLLPHASAVLATGDLERASKYYDAILKISDSEDARNKLAEIANSLRHEVKTPHNNPRNHDKIKSSAQNSLAHELILRGHDARLAGKFNKAKAFYDEALEVSPQNKGAVEGLAKLTGEHPGRNQSLASSLERIVYSTAQDELLVQLEEDLRNRKHLFRKQLQSEQNFLGNKIIANINKTTGLTLYTLFKIRSLATGNNFPALETWVNKKIFRDYKKDPQLSNKLFKVKFINENNRQFLEKSLGFLFPSLRYLEPDDITSLLIIAVKLNDARLKEILRYIDQKDGGVFKDKQIIDIAQEFLRKKQPQLALFLLETNASTANPAILRIHLNAAIECGDKLKANRVLEYMIGKNMLSLNIIASYKKQVNSFPKDLNETQVNYSRTGEQKNKFWDGTARIPVDTTAAKVTGARMPQQEKSKKRK